MLRVTVTVTWQTGLRCSLGWKYQLLIKFFKHITVGLIDTTSPCSNKELGTEQRDVLRSQSSWNVLVCFFSPVSVCSARVTSHSTSSGTWCSVSLPIVNSFISLTSSVCVWVGVCVQCLCVCNNRYCSILFWASTLYRLAAPTQMFPLLTFWTNDHGFKRAERTYRNSSQHFYSSLHACVRVSVQVFIMLWGRMELRLSWRSELEAGIRNNSENKTQRMPG